MNNQKYQERKGMYNSEYDKEKLIEQCYELLNSEIELMTFDHRVEAINDDPLFTPSEKFSATRELYSDTKAFDMVSSSIADVLNVYMDSELEFQYELTKLSRK